MRTVLMAALLVCACCAQDQTGSASFPSAAAIPPLKQTVVVTGTWEPVPLEESDREVEVYQVNGARTLFDSFADYLKLDSSVDLQERAPGTVQSDISIRGGTFGQTLVLLNGMRINDAQSGHHNMDLPLPLDAVSELQVLRGSGSTEYGSDAVAGVLNIITEQPAGPELRLRSALGNFGVNEESGSLSYGRHAIDEQLVFSRDFSTGFMPDRDYRDLSFASITHAKSALGFTDILLALSDRPFGADQFYGPYPSWERTKGWYASLRQELGKNTEADFSFRRHTDLFVLFRDDPSVYTNWHYLESLEGALRRSDAVPGGGHVHYGAEYYEDTIHSTNLGDHARNHEAAYASWDVRVLRRFSFTAGLRDDVYGGLSNQLSPTVAAGVWLSSQVKLRGSLSRAFRLPSFTDLYYSDPANRGNPNLRPEKAWDYEGGVDWYPSQRIRASATVFQRRDSDLIDYVRDSPTAIWVATNFQHLVFTGVEGTVEARLRADQVVSLEYTALKGDQAATGIYSSKYAFNYPVNDAVLAWQGAFRTWLAGRTRIGVVQRFGQSPYALWDASLARPGGRLRPFLQFTNLTSTVYQEIVGVSLPKRGVIGGMELFLPAGR